MEKTYSKVKCKSSFLSSRAVGEDGAAAFYALIIHDIGFDGVLFDDGGGPLAELQDAFGVDLVADGDNGGELVVFAVVVFAVGGNSLIYAQF